MARRSLSRSPSPDYKRRKQSHASYNRSPSPTRPRYQGRRDDRRDRDARDYSRHDDRRSNDSYRDKDRDKDSHRGGSYRRDRDRYDSRRDDRDRPRDSRKRSRSPSSPPPATAVPSKSATPVPKKSSPVPPSGSAALSAEEQKRKERVARLEAWKKEQNAKKALSEAKAKAAALAAGKGPTGSSATPAIIPPSVPPKPTVQINRAALNGLGLKGLPVKRDSSKATAKAAPSMDDFAETDRKLVKLGDMPAVDLAQVETSVGENLEADDDDDVLPSDAPMKDAEPENEDEDPLDAFMTDVTKEVKKVNAQDRLKMGGKAPPGDPNAEEDDDEVEVSNVIDELDTTNMKPEEILALAAKKVKKKELADVDHTKITYEPFRKDFYRPAPEVKEMDQEDVDLLRLALDGIKIRGLDCPKPVTKWSHCGLPAATLDVIKRLGYTAPTAIQAQAIPAIMSGRDVIGVAKTGSGKTIAFLLPLFRQIKDQRPLETMEGPMAIVMTPTRELALQIHRECKPFLKALNLRAVAAYGGTPIKDQIAEMKKGTEIIVCTPGRMIDLLSANSGRVTNLKRVTYLVLDEADRMFDMGFEPQVMKILKNIRPDRQTVLFSATFPKQMDSLARKILLKPLEITVGGRSVVAPEIEQIIEVRTEDTKFNRLLEILGQTYYEDKDTRTLLFVDRQEAADNLLRELIRKGYLCMSLHGGKDQIDRDSTIVDFKNGVVPILTATSVAARGLDVKQLKLVINYDAPNHMEDYVHRAGRTGRAGNKGTCITFITPEQERYSVDIWRALQASNAMIPPELDVMAKEFLQKVKEGKARQYEGSGFGGKGLEKLDQDREAKDRAQRSAYGEPIEEKKAAEAGEEGEPAATFDFKVEVRRGPAPEASKTGIIPVPAETKEEAERRAASMRAAEETIAKNSASNSASGSSAVRQAQSVVAKLNAQVRATKLALQASSTPIGEGTGKPDATDFHAIVPINDYPQKARWRVTNKETMVQLIDMTGASVTNKGIYYETNKEPAPGQPPKLHLLIESNDEMKVERAVREIKRLLIEASTAALQAEARNPTGIGRYSVL